MKHKAVSSGNGSIAKASNKQSSPNGQEFYLKGKGNKSYCPKISKIG